MTRLTHTFRNALMLAIAGIAVSGCVTTAPDPVTDRYASPIGGPPVISNETPYSRSLACLDDYSRADMPPRIAVGQINDYTGKEEADGTGRKLTQGAALMAISALSKSGVRLVERFDTSVAELELKYANNKLIGGEIDKDPYRKILAGSIPGSDYYLVGGITELNFNTRSEGGEGDYSGVNATSLKASLSVKTYVMNGGLDLRRVDTKTLEVVDVISYQKQIIGREISAGVFEILGMHIINAGDGDSALEPVQLTVRTVIKRADLEMASRPYGVGTGVCNVGGPKADPRLDRARSPYAAASYAQPYSPYQPYAAPAQAPPYVSAQPTPKENSYDQTRQDPYRWYSAADAGGNAGLRGGIRLYRIGIYRRPDGIVGGSVPQGWEEAWSRSAHGIPAIRGSMAARARAQFGAAYRK